MDLTHPYDNSTAILLPKTAGRFVIESCHVEYLKPPCRWIFALSLLLASPSYGAEQRDIGLTQKGGRIQATIVAGASPAAPTVLLVGGVTGNDESVRIVEQEVRSFERVRQDRRNFQ